MDWARILAYVTGTVDQELLARNEYLAAENRIMKAQLNGRMKLSDAERGALGEIGHRLGRKVLADIATVAELARSNEYFSIVRLPDPARSVSSLGPVLALTRKHSRLVEPGLFRKTSKKIGGVRLFEWAG